MATKTTPKSDAARAAREAKATAAAPAPAAAKPVEYLVTPDGHEEFQSFKVTAANKTDADTKAASQLAERDLATAKFKVARFAKPKPAAAEKAPREHGVQIVDELPPKSTGGGNRNTGPSIWVERLQAVADSQSGKGILKEYPTKSTAHTTAYNLRKGLKEGKYEPFGSGDFLIEVRGLAICATVTKPA